MGLDVVIITYNNYDSVNRIIEYLLNKDVVNKIYVVDNSDKKQRLSDKLSDPRLVHIISENIGYGQAFNLAIRRYNLLEQFSNLLLLNDDVVFSENAVDELDAFSRQIGHKNWGYIAPNNLGTNDEFNRLIKENIYNGEEVDFLPASCWLINPGALLKSGLFHPFFFMYGEDKELSNRFKANGFKNYYCASAKINHSFTYTHLRFGLRIHFVKGNLAWILLDNSLKEKRLFFLRTIKLYLFNKGKSWIVPCILALFTILAQKNKLRKT